MVMHGLVTPEDAKAKTGEIASEFSVQCRHSAADVTKPAEIRCSSLLIQYEAYNPLWGHACIRPSAASTHGKRSLAATFSSS